MCSAASRATGCRTACATTFAARATVATVPVGYGDGVPRNLGLRGGEVLVDGRRWPITGAVTMDQLMADCGDRPSRPATRSC